MSKKIKIYASTGKVGSKIEDVIEIEDDTTEEEIEEMAKDWLFNTIDWGYCEDNE